MIYLKEVKLNKNNNEIFPFNIPLIRSLDNVKFGNITFIVGDNGSGKSTLLESIACKINIININKESLNSDPYLKSARKLSKEITCKWNNKTHRGFFFRGEDYTTFIKGIDENIDDLKIQLSELEEEFKDKSEYVRGLATGPARSQIHALQNRYDGDLNEKSHGESYLEFFRSRIVPNGLYILDEPETPLSPMSQYSLLMLINDMLKEGTQFIIATHSPILMSLPGATIYQIEEGILEKVNYDQIDSVNFMKSFLNEPERYLRYLND